MFSPLSVARKHTRQVSLLQGTGAPLAADGLEQLGLNTVDDEPLQEALQVTYPDGHEDEPMPSILMTVFRHLKAKDRGKG